jgi:plastocyanin
MLLAISVTSCAQDADSTVELTPTRRYDPATLTVPVGTTVTWVNSSDEAHSVTAYGSSLPSGAKYFSSTGFSSEAQARAHVEKLLTAGQKYSVVFDVPGTYEYFCIPHEDQGMTGKIRVEG